jgi:hypothetical protein
MIELHMQMLAARVDPVGDGRYSIMCGCCRRSAVVVARTSASAWLLLAADGWHRASEHASVASCPECAVRHAES